MASLRLRRLALPAVALFAFVGALTVSAAASPPGKGGARHQLDGTKPAWTAGTAPKGSVSGSQQESAKVWLAPRNADQLTALAKAVSDLSSSEYRQFLTHDQYVAQFAPAASDVAAVNDWLQQSK
jgi:pro-kumamolisin-like protein